MRLEREIRVEGREEGKGGGLLCLHRGLRLDFQCFATVFVSKSVRTSQQNVRKIQCVFVIVDLVSKLKKRRNPIILLIKRISHRKENDSRFFFSNPKLR